MRSFFQKTPSPPSLCLPLKEPWYSGDSAIVFRHAGGGVNGHIYTNSKEAILNSICCNAHFIEVDVSLTCDNIPVLAHHFNGEPPTYQEFINGRINHLFTPMSLSQIMGYHARGKWILFIDGKGNLFEIAKFLQQNFPDADYERIVFQFASPEYLYDVAKLRLFPNLHFSTSLKDAIQLLPLFSDYKIKTISISNFHLHDAELVQFLNQAGIYVFAHTINDLERYKLLSSFGVRGIFSDVLTERDINEFSKSKDIL